MKRKRYGARRHNAKFSKHNADADQHGQPLYSEPLDWATTISAWPCELVTTRGGEVLRGRQVTERTTHVLFGEYFGAATATVDQRVEIAGQTYAITAAYDADGLSQEMRVELRQQR